MAAAIRFSGWNNLLVKEEKEEICRTGIGLSDNVSDGSSDIRRAMRELKLEQEMKSSEGEIEDDRERREEEEDGSDGDSRKRKRSKRSNGNGIG